LIAAAAMAFPNPDEHPVIIQTLFSIVEKFKFRCFITVEYRAAAKKNVGF
jgi:hypothetical protein